MGQYDVQQVCRNGHQVTDRFYGSPEFRREYCPTCGASTMHACEHCGAEIRGDYDVPGVIALGSRTAVPTYCEQCGEAFPWRETLQKTAEAAAAGPQGDALTLIFAICSRFHLVVRQLRDRYDRRVTLDVDDEYDVQDLLHALLHVFFEDVRPEECTPSYAGKSSRMDFLLRDESIVVETKMTRPGLGAREIADQLIIDIDRYRTHERCARLVCLVYDPDGRVVNPRGLESDLSGERDDIAVHVFVVPKGY